MATRQKNYNMSLLLFEVNNPFFHLQAVQLPKDLYATDLHWYPRSIGGKKQAQAELYALAATDGKHYPQTCSYTCFNLWECLPFLIFPTCLCDSK